MVLKYVLSRGMYLDPPWMENRYRTLFPYKPDPMPSFFRHTLMSIIQNLSLFWGHQKQERKNDYNSIILGAKNKVRSNFIWEKLMDFLLFNKGFQNFILSNNTYQKSWLYNTNIEQILNSKSLFVVNLLLKIWIYGLHFHFCVLKN